MKFIYRRGFVYITNAPRSYDWCDSEYDSKKGEVQYFPLNLYTKQCFKRDILPYLTEGSIDRDVYMMIMGFRQNPSRDEPLDMYEVPEGITLMPHQEDALSLMATHDRYGFFYGTGTGKTLIAITWLMNAMPGTALIVTPQKVVGQYRKELDKYIPGNNYEVTNFEQLSKFTCNHYDALIVDESHRAKNYSSQINKFLREISKETTYCYLFTGSPMDKSRHEILPQLAILDERVMPVKTRVYERYFRINDFFQPEHEIATRRKELTAVINAYTYGVKTEDVIDLPKENTHILKCPHPDEMYDHLVKYRLARKEDMKCIADTSANLRMALKELCSGILSMTDKNLDRVWVHTKSPKYNQLLSLLRTLDSGIIYYEFTESAKEILDVIDSLNKTCVLVNGETTAKKTHELVTQFKEGYADFLVIQSRSGNAGLDLTNTNNVVFYSLPDSYIVFHQAKSRIRRYGQKRECNYYYLLCEESVEEKLYETLGRKKSFNDKVFAQYINKE